MNKISKTVRIYIPDKIYKDAKEMAKRRHYPSVSEFIRDSMRKSLYTKVTENGFTEEFEEEVLRAATEPKENDIVLETDEDIDNYFRHLKKPPRKKRVGDQSHAGSRL